MKALVTGIKSYVSRLSDQDQNPYIRKLDAFERIKTRKDLISATRFNGNTGNFFIGEGAIEAIGRRTANFYDFGYLLSQLKISTDAALQINSSYDILVFVTANLLRSDYDASAEAEMMQRIDLPVVILGIGCQRAEDLESNIPDGTRRLIEEIRKKEHYIFTRGTNTEAYLKRHGLRNVWATGCPSLFFRPENVKAAICGLREVEWSHNRNIAFCGYLGKGLSSVEDILLFSNKYNKSSYILQDEHMFSDYIIGSFDQEEIYDDVSGRVSKYSFEGQHHIENISQRIFFNTHQWRAVLAEHDVCFGRRFHGIVSGLQAGIPGIMIAVDDRMREMIGQLQLPFIDLRDWQSSTDKIKLIEKTSFDFNYDNFCEHYDSNIENFRKRMKSIGFE